MSQLPEDIWNKINLYNSHPCADIIRNLRIELHCTGTFFRHMLEIDRFAELLSCYDTYLKTSWGKNPNHYYHHKYLLGDEEYEIWANRFY